ncbi:FAD-binding domain-containing protein [Spirulina major]|uniref:FAD-binding domain-containing protein n=1 Tax=Spirulina major TaxID=270636 RepID=UPI000933811F
MGLILLWHRRDLRLSDHLGLQVARQRSRQVVGLFCFDPGILGRDDVAPARVAYLVGCLAALAQRYQAVGSQLLILRESPQTAVVRLAVTLGAAGVVWTEEVEPDGRERDRTLRQALAAANIPVQTVWDHLLCEPGQVLTKAGSPYTVYGPFWKTWRSQPKAEPCPTVTDLQGLTAAEDAIATAAGVVPLPTAAELGFIWENGFPVEPGETAALERLEEFCDRALASYDERRNYPADPGTSQLSAALKFGAIGIRTIWHATQTQYAAARSDEHRTNIQTWQQELAWREFYHHALYFFPELAEGPYRAPFRDFPWQNNREQFQAWCEGRTGYPIVDAAMRQLNQTGWMHNRCRMIVASFLTKDLIIDWRWGEKYFMQTLVDGDLASNNGGWQWSASSGMDPKPLRIFNPSSQAKKFDPDGDYVRQWVEELRSLDPEPLITGQISPLERLACGYPSPIVDHAIQQRTFKHLYKTAKQSSESP